MNSYIINNSSLILPSLSIYPLAKANATENLLRILKTRSLEHCYILKYMFTLDPHFKTMEAGVPSSRTPRISPNIISISDYKGILVDGIRHNMKIK